MTGGTVEGRKKDFRGCFIFSSSSWWTVWADDTNGVNSFESEVGEIRREQEREAEGTFGKVGKVWTEQFLIITRDRAALLLVAQTGLRPDYVPLVSS